MTINADYTDEIAALVGNVPGVTALYSAEPVIAHAAKAALAAVIDSPVTPHRLEVDAGPAGVSVTVHIGVSRQQSAADVCRAVHDEIAANITATGERIDTISVKVGRIS